MYRRQTATCSMRLSTMHSLEMTMKCITVQTHSHRRYVTALTDAAWHDMPSYIFYYMFLCRHFENHFHVQFCNLQIFFAVNLLNDLAECTAYNTLLLPMWPVTKLNSFSQTIAASNCCCITNVCIISTCLLCSRFCLSSAHVRVCVCLSVQKLKTFDEKLMTLGLT